MKSIDIKSLLIGILGTALVLMLTGATAKTSKKAEEGEAGVYSIECGDTYNRKCLIFDTRYGIVRGSVDTRDVHDTPQLIHKSVLDD